MYKKKASKTQITAHKKTPYWKALFIQDWKENKYSAQTNYLKK